MVKVEFGLLRYLEEEDFRVMVALEMAMRNHDVAPTVLIERIAQLAHGGARKRLQHLLKYKIVHHESLMYDGYAMKYATYDFLAVHTMVKRGTLHGIGTRVGCGKESDIMSVIDPHGNEAVMKLQRLGRCSFRSVARNRDYKGGGKARRGESWFYLSRLAATKEFAFMKLLYDEGFPVPKPIDHNRHAVVMERVNGTLLNNIQAMDHAQKVYERALGLMVKLAQHGLVHGDFNEFNMFVTDDYRIVLIDFPQMVSTDHHNAAELFERDVVNMANFFKRRFKIEQQLYPKLETDVERTERLDQKVAASGAFTRQQQKELEILMAADEAEKEADEAQEEEDEDTADMPAGDEAADDDEAPVKGRKKAHFDPSVPTVAALAAHAKAQAAKPAPTAEDGDDDAASDVAEPEDDRGSIAPSIASTAATIAKRLAQKARADNPNFKGESDAIDTDHVWERTKARGRHLDNREFNRNLHRNSQKGRHKRRIQREVNNVHDHPTELF